MWLDRIGTSDRNIRGAGFFWPENTGNQQRIRDFSETGETEKAAEKTGELLLRKWPGRIYTEFTSSPTRTAG